MTVSYRPWCAGIGLSIEVILAGRIDQLVADQRLSRVGVLLAEPRQVLAGVRDDDPVDRPGLQRQPAGLIL
jgi:hypothetical protein